MPPNWTDVPLSVKVYIDDLNNLEKVRHHNAVSIMSEEKTVLLAHAHKSEENFNRIKERASEILMKVNSKKTQLLCISGNNNIEVRSYIRSENAEIQSGSELKILGFWFGQRPNVDVHLEKLLTKFRSRLWALRHLRKSGMCQSDLLFIYLAVLRPVLDFAAPAYHSLLTATQRDLLESLQRRVFKIIYGNNTSYRAALELSGVSTLNDRRQCLTKNFAISAQKNPRYSDGWFPKKPISTYPLRNQPRFQEDRFRTERMRKNPLTYMRTLLNGM